ncbi:thiol reductant ABC exporter subunit CydD [Salinisphaera sp. LB1]|uniref:thiol reductant ABC exporter subunit CydD n=1 Tax=Salinisphaera sp. LB1 TaxID=2183911 RepID=UPI000D7080FB|nr:thiol reductant ABC exporter subunit CydD [Salinisphaera sp. LB1]AWN16578.1 Transport ATP-binding protein CydD [Salinisphaera sp. LB1]
MSAKTSNSTRRGPEGWLRAHLAGHRALLFGAVAVGLIDAPLLIAQAWLLALIINAVAIDGQGLDAVMPWLWCLLGVFAARVLTGILRDGLAFEGAARIKHRLREALFEHCIALGPDWARGARSGTVSHLLADAIEAMDRYYRDYLPQTMLAAVLPIVLLLVIFPNDWVSGLILLITAPLVPFFMVLIGKGTEALNQRQWRRLARLSAHFFDAIEGLTTLKLFGASRRELDAVAAMSEGYRRETLAVLRLAFVSSLILEFLTTLGIAMVAVYIGFRLYYGEMAFWPGLFVLLLAPEFYRPLRDMGAQYHARMEAIGAAEGLIEVFARQRPEDTASRAAGEAISRPERIECRDLAFAYADGAPVFSGVDLALRRGRRIALVGPSGAGKTTLAHLLLGFLRPQAGAIRVDGVDLASLPRSVWLQQVAWVPQRPTLFHGTLADNIRLGCADVDDAAVARAARQANADAFIEALPDGYETVIGDRGQGLSGGQIQRIALARAFLKDAALVVLDEPSASLDPASEAAITDAVARLAADRMLLIIAHRLDTVREADEILLLADGAIAERGRHDALMAADGRYARLWSLYRADDAFSGVRS